MGAGDRTGIASRQRRITRPGSGDRIGRPAQVPDRAVRQERAAELRERLRDRPSGLVLRPDDGYRPGRPDRPYWSDRRYRSDYADRWDDRWHDRHWYHDHWHYGHWPVYWPRYWVTYWWDAYPVLATFGLTTWGVNRLGWATGYYSYFNPYATRYVINRSSIYYDYSQPIAVVSGVDAATAPPDASAEAMAAFDRAMEAFYAGEYETSLAWVNEALKEMPDDTAVHEFRALVLFALGRYDESAATLYAVLSVGPGWNWTTMSSLYPSVDVYTTHLRTLETYTRSRPLESAPRFVLAYHYLTTGYEEAAAAQLRRVVARNPEDDVARSMLLSLDPQADVPKPEVAPPPKPASPIEPSDVVGTWTAMRDRDEFVVDLNEDGDFSWTYQPSGGANSIVSGVWAVDEDGVLALDMGEDDVMLAQLNLTGGELDFYMLGDTRGAEPLTFTK